ncbi:MAG: MarR family transcriptional regulator [Bacteroidota bacterium]
MNQKEANTETKNFGALIDRTLKLIKQRYLQVFREISADLTTEQWVLLDKLAERDGVTQTELASGSFKNAPTVSRIIELMMKKELVTKAQGTEDKRQYIITLSTKGKDLHAHVLPHVHRLRRQGWNHLSEGDYEQFVRIMRQLEENFS